MQNILDQETPLSDSGSCSNLYDASITLFSQTVYPGNNFLNSKLGFSIAQISDSIKLIYQNIDRNPETNPLLHLSMWRQTQTGSPSSPFQHVF